MTRLQATDDALDTCHCRIELVVYWPPAAQLNPLKLPLGSEATMQVVSVQMDMMWQDKVANHAKPAQLLQGIAVEPGSLILLPEMFATGFCMDVNVTAQSSARESEQVLKDIAKQYDSAVLGGVVGEIDGHAATNEAVAFGPDGGELVRYYKQQPFSMSGEGKKYRRGDSHQIFEWQGVKIAPFVCYDLRFPELFRPAVRDGAEMLAVIACWPQRRSEHWVRLLQARAIENLAAVVGVNRCGEEPGLTFDGRSTAFDHMGNQLFEADAREQVVTTEFDFEAVRLWRETFPALRDMR